MTTDILQACASEAINSSIKLKEMCEALQNQGTLPIFAINVYLIDMNSDESLIRLNDLLGGVNEC